MTNGTKLSKTKHSQTKMAKLTGQALPTLLTWQETCRTKLSNRQKKKRNAPCGEIGVDFLGAKALYPTPDIVSPHFKRALPTDLNVELSRPIVRDLLPTSGT